MKAILCFLVRRLECRKSGKRLVGTGVITEALVQLCNLRHLVIRQLEVEDIEIVPDMVYILAAWNHDKAHLRVPTKDHLCRRLTILVAQLLKNRRVDQRPPF